MVQGKSIGVDPVFRLQKPLLGRKPQLLLFLETSDSFFSANRLEALGILLKIAFIDGMHLFEYTLRDLLNAELYSDPNGIIFVHDCCPFSIKMTTRNLEALPKTWTGDVWKLIPILQEYRPDLELTVLDVRPTGLLAIKGLKPGRSQPLFDLSAVVQRYENLDLETFGVDRFARLFQFTNAAASLGSDLLGVSKIADIDLALPNPEIVTP